MNDLILIVSNKGAEGDVEDMMVVNTGTENVTRFKDLVKIKEGPRAVRSFTFQGMVIPGSIEVVVNKGDTKVVKVGGNCLLFFCGKGLGRCVHTRSFRSLVTVSVATARLKVAEPAEPS